MPVFGMRAPERGRHRAYRRVIASARRQLVAVLAVALVGATVSIILDDGTVANATTPGTPGVAQAGTPVFTEDFANQSLTSAVSILNYTGSSGTTYVAGPGGTGADGETYTADASWTPAYNACNGWVFNSTTARPTTDTRCTTTAWPILQGLASAMGTYEGQNATQAAANAVLSSFTNSSTGTQTAGYQLKTKTTIPAVAGHYYAVSAVFGEASCAAANNASETLYLVVNGTANALASGLNPCTAPGTTSESGGTYQVATLQSAAVQVPTTGTPTLGLQLYNATANGTGNDVAFDLPQIVDVTPQLDKAFSPATIPTGGTSTLTFTITNTSELAAKNGWTFTDALPSGVKATGVNSTTCASGVVTAASGGVSATVTGNLSAGQTSCTASVQVTSATNGTYTNSGCVSNTGTAIAGCTSNFTTLTGVNAPGSATLTVTSPTIALVKSATVTPAADQNAAKAGDTITYSFLVTNTSGLTLTSVGVTDAPLGTVNCPSTTLAVGASETCTAPATHTVTQSDVDSGNVTNTATASGTNGATVTASSTATVTTAPATPMLSIAKSATPTSVSTVGSTVTYSFVVTNTGNVTITNATVADTQSAPAGALASGPTCPAGAASLAPGASVTCTATYTVTQADITNGTIKDSATASGKDPSNNTVTSPASAATVTATQTPAVTLVKTAVPTTVTAAGQTVTYSFKVTNSGNLPVTSLSIADTLTAPAGPALTISCPVTSLAPGVNTTCTATYTTTQADIDNGSINNSATANATDSNGHAVASSPSTATVAATQSGGLTLTKSATPATITAAGQTVAYSFLVRNTGNVTVTGLSIADTFTAPAGPVPTITCPTTTLAPGATTTCMASYVSTQADVDNGSIKNSATASGKDPKNSTVTSPASTATVSVTRSPALTLAKSAAPTSVSATGSTITYTFRVTNSGNETMTGLAIVDTFTAPAGPVPTITCVATTLAPGATTTCSATYSVTQSDVDNGSINNSATATAKDPTSATTTSNVSTAAVSVSGGGALSLAKTANPTTITAAGQTVAYSFAVTNNGNVTISSLAIADIVLGPGRAGADDQLPDHDARSRGHDHLHRHLRVDAGRRRQGHDQELGDRERP